MYEVQLFVEWAPAHPYHRVENLYEQSEASDHYHHLNPSVILAAATAAFTFLLWHLEKGPGDMTDGEKVYLKGAKN